jgi:hypothetical protein
MWSDMVHVLAAGTDVPNPPAQAPAGLQTLANTLLGWLKWGVLAASVAGLLICSAMIVVGRRNRNQMATEGLIGAAWVMGGLALASVAAVLVSTFSLN